MLLLRLFLLLISCRRVANKQTKIEDWFPLFGGLAGKITGHPRQEEFLTDCQLTSILVEVHQDEGYVITRSGTRIELGTPHESFTDKKIPKPSFS